MPHNHETLAMLHISLGAMLTFHSCQIFLTQTYASTSWCLFPKKTSKVKSHISQSSPSKKDKKKMAIHLGKMVPKMLVLQVIDNRLIVYKLNNLLLNPPEQKTIIFLISFGN